MNDKQKKEIKLMQKADTKYTSLPRPQMTIDLDNNFYEITQRATTKWNISYLRSLHHLKIISLIS